MARPRWRNYRPDETPEPEPSSGPAPYVPPAAPRPVRSLEERTVRRTGPRPGPFVAAAAIVAGGAVAGVVALGGNDDDVAVADPAPVDVGFDALLDAMREDLDSTVVLEATVYDDYAVIAVPYTDDPADQRYVGYLWRDGELEEWTKGTSDDIRFDLAEVDDDLLPRMCAEVEALVEEPDTCYVIVRRPDADDLREGWFSAYASNEFSQSAWAEFDLDGTVLERRPPS